MFLHLVSTTSSITFGVRATCLISWLPISSSCRLNFLSKYSLLSRLSPTRRRMMAHDVAEETRVKAFNWCRDYLGGTWTQIKIKDFQIRDLREQSPQILPRHFVCALPRWLACANVNEPRHALLHLNRHPKLQANNFVIPKALKNEPSKLLLRVYGEIFHESDAPLLDSIIFSLLSERQQGPRLYGVFAEGRLEQYIPSRCLTTSELAEPRFSFQIAEKLAKFHQLDLPLCKVPRWLNQVLDKWTNLTLSLSLDDPKKQKILDEVRSHDLVKEVEFSKKLISKSNSPVVFCHNDCQEGNILLTNGSPDVQENKLILIDYEYASYNYRACDIANHFAEWTINYSKPDPPFFSLITSDYPTTEQQLAFLRVYLKNIHEAGTGEGGEYRPSEAEELQLLQEIKRFTPVLHFLWAMWGCVQAKISHTDFGYEEYGLARMNEYYRTKAKFLNDS